MTVVRRRLPPVGLAVAVLATTAGSCSRSTTETFVARPAPPVVGVTMEEYRFDIPAQVPAGRVVFEVGNAGHERHKVALLALDETIPPIDVQLHGSDRRIITSLAGVPPREPGRRGTFAVDLIPGQRYALVCFLSTPAGELHALKGMNAEFRATAG